MAYISETVAVGLCALSIQGGDAVADLSDLPRLQADACGGGGVVLAISPDAGPGGGTTIYQHPSVGYTTGPPWHPVDPWPDRFAFVRSLPPKSS
jgi:hypothetical protein